MRLFLLAVPVALVGLLVALARRVVVTVGVNEHRGLVEIARRTRRWRVAGLLLGGAAAAGGLAGGWRGCGSVARRPSGLSCSASGSTPWVGSPPSGPPCWVPASCSAPSPVS